MNCYSIVRIFNMLILIACLASCAVTRNSVAEGPEFQAEKLSTLKPGMSKDRVIATLGKPYASGRDWDGNDFLL
jgi:outer membrane protein assembly factor BamE (lipoprotein component of BamABCDE complex)